METQTIIKEKIAKVLAGNNPDDLGWELAKCTITFPEIPLVEIEEMIREGVEQPEEDIFKFYQSVRRIKFADLYESAVDRGRVSDYVPSAIAPNQLPGDYLLYVRIVREIALINLPYVFMIDQSRMQDYGLRLIKAKKNETRESYNVRFNRKGREILKLLKDNGVIRKIRDYRPHVDLAWYHWSIDLPENCIQVNEDPPWSRRSAYNINRTNAKDDELVVAATEKRDISSEECLF